MYYRREIESCMSQGKSGETLSLNFQSMFLKSFRLADVTIIRMKRGACGWRAGHFHNQASEILWCVEGSVKIQLQRKGEQEELTIKEDDTSVIIIPPGVWHRYWVSGGSQLVIYSCMAYADRAEKDIYGEDMTWNSGRQTLIEDSHSDEEVVQS